jgi:hypothetical protein
MIPGFIDRNGVRWRYEDYEIYDGFAGDRDNRGDNP